MLIEQVIKLTSHSRNKIDNLALLDPDPFCVGPGQAIKPRLRAWSHGPKDLNLFTAHDIWPMRASDCPHARYNPHARSRLSQVGRDRL
jgi:hypothetical protein